MEPTYYKDCKILLDFCVTNDSSVLDRRLGEGRIDWGNLLYFADINGLLGILWKMTKGIEDSRIPWRVAIRLDEFISKQKRRWRCYTDVFNEILVEKITSRPPIILKGASFKCTIYKDAPEIRGIGDIDLLIQSKDAQNVENFLIARGFWLRPGKNGATAFKETENDRIVIDLHIDDPSKINRNPMVAFDIFSKEIILLGNGLETISYELSLLYACKHFCEHEEDFRKIYHQDDIRLFRLVDILLLCNISDLRKSKQLAEVLNWTDELERTLYYIKEIFNLETEITPCYEIIKNEISTPVGNFKWPWAIRERVLRVDRAEWLSKEMGVYGERSTWYTSKEGNKSL